MIAHPFNMDNKLAGKDWMSGFMKRHVGGTSYKESPTQVHNNVVLLSFPLHCTHKLQPLDVLLC